MVDFQGHWMGSWKSQVVVLAETLMMWPWVCFLAFLSLSAFINRPRTLDCDLFVLFLKCCVMRKNQDEVWVVVGWVSRVWVGGRQAVLDTGKE